MDEYVTIASFKLPHQVHIIKGRLESEGISCRLKDEYTANTQYFSFAVNGVKLQVRPMDYERAKEILIENGYKFNEEESVPKWYTFLDEKTLLIPKIKEFSLGKRLIILAIIFILLLAVLFYFLTPPKAIVKTKFLTENPWCLEVVYFQRNEIKINTSHRPDTGICTHSVQFAENGFVDFPNFYGRTVHAKWKIIDKEHLEIFEADTLECLFNAEFSIIKGISMGTPYLTLMNAEAELYFENR